MTDGDRKKTMTEQEIRVELGAVLDQLARLPGDALADRARLRKRQADLVQMLRSIEIPGAGEIATRWSDLAGSKTDGQDPKPVIVSPIESGSSGL
jgi:hypothetical protein